jgi:hypothetical protein
MKSLDAQTICLRFAQSCLVSALVLTGMQPARAEDNPAPPEPIRRLAAFAGKFDGEGSLTMGGSTSPLKLHHELIPFADGWGMMVHETVTSPVLGTYLSESLFGYDIGAGRMHLFTVSNGADTHDHAGTWTDDKHLTLRYTGIKDGKPMVEDLTASFDGPDQYSFRSVVTVDGKEESVFQASMKRRTEMTRR